MHEKLEGCGSQFFHIKIKIVEAVTICLLNSTANPEKWAEWAAVFGWKITIG